MEGFSLESCEYISEMVEEKVSLLRKNRDFNDSYLRLSNVLEELEQTLSDKQKVQLDEIVQLFFKTEKYYFALAYSLGVKYGDELKKI